VIAFGCSIPGAEAFSRYAQPGIERTREPDSKLLAFAEIQPMARTYNLILDDAAGLEGLEALVLVNSHTEIADPAFCQTVRTALSDETVGMIGPSGATAVRSLAWWEGDVVSAEVEQHYGEFGTGSLPAFSWTDRRPPPADVEALDGQLLVLSPWAVRNLRFDESLRYGYGTDLDFGFQVRGAGKRLEAVEMKAIHHRPLELVSDPEVWIESHVLLAEKWFGTVDPDGDGDGHRVGEGVGDGDGDGHRVGDGDGDGHRVGEGDGDREEQEAWIRRARLAEARREAARAFAFSRLLDLDAQVLELERSLDEKLHGPSWKLTAPLRMLNHLRREAAERRSGAPPAPRVWVPPSSRRRGTG
jgi:hypothetical protein